MLKVSDDGSHTLLSDTFDVTYHSKHGAITESNVVFINAGLNYFYNKGAKNISIFEMGFGTGLNAFLSCLWAAQNQISLHYYTVETFPVSTHIVNSLNYPDILGHSEVFHKIHSTNWEQKHLISPYFELRKYNVSLEEFHPECFFDVIFYDAFGPASQPHLWEIPILTKMHKILYQEGILVTYCAQGAFKRNLKDIGFRIENIPGPPGKREMTRAIKTDK